MSRYSPGEHVAGRFIVEGWLASGGMAEVYVAEMVLARGVKKRVALKRIHTHLAEDSHFLTMFLDEARVASQLSHPGIVSVHDVVEEDGEVLLVLDFVPGWDLSSILKTGRRDSVSMPIGMAVSVGIEIAETLAYVHTAIGYSGAPLNIVHRDVNPSNILVAEDGTIRLLDFGVAKAAERVHQTATASIKGKLAYLAPEQANIGGIVDHRADIYGLGLILYEVVTGQRAIYGEGDLHLLEMAKAPTHLPVTELRPEAPQVLADLISKLLAINPDDRFSDGHAVAMELDHLRSSVTDTQKSKIRMAVKTLMGGNSRPLRKPSIARGNKLDAAFAQVAGLQLPRPNTAPVEKNAGTIDPLGQIGLPQGDSSGSLLPLSTGEDSRGFSSFSASQVASTRRNQLGLFVVAVILFGTALFLFQQKRGEPEKAAGTAMIGYVRLSSKPTGAQIKIDGRPWPERTPTLIQSPVGQARLITIEDPDHEVWTRRITAEAEGQMKLHAALLRKQGQVTITSTPAGAHILVDGEEWGRSPFQKKGLARKKYQVELSLKGHQSLKFELDLASGFEVNMDKKLTPILAFGSLDVSSRPWAQVFIDGKLVAESTPALGLKVAVGEHTVRFVNPRLNKSAEQKVFIEKGTTESLVVDLH